MKFSLFLLNCLCASVNTAVVKLNNYLSFINKFVLVLSYGMLLINQIQSSSEFQTVKSEKAEHFSISVRQKLF